MDNTDRKVWIVLYGFIFDKHNFTDEVHGFVAKHNFNRGDVAAFDDELLAKHWIMTEGP